MASGLLSLKWNNHRSTFFHELSTIRSKEAYNDVTIACDGNFYPLHKFVLSTCSDYFEEMFERTTCKNPIIVLKDIKCEELEALLNYMYVGEVNVVQEKLAGLIKAAECLKIKGLAVPDEDPENSRENANVSSREQNKRSQRNEGSPRAKKRRRDNTADVSEEILSPVNKIRTSNGRSRDSQSNRKSTSEEMSDNKPNNEEMENSSINANRLSESSSNKANSSSHKKDFEPEEVTLEDEPVKTEPIDLDNDESNDNAADNKDTLHEELGFDASDSMAGEEDNYVDVDPSMLGQGEEAMPGSSGFQGNSFPLWEGEGSLSNFPSEGFSGDGSSQARQMVHETTSSYRNFPTSSLSLHNLIRTSPSATSVNQIFNLMKNKSDITGQNAPLFMTNNNNNIYEKVPNRHLLNQQLITDQMQQSQQQQCNHGCPFCTKVFRTKRDQQRHVRVHTGEKPFLCPLCPYRASRKDHLRRHGFVHETGGMRESLDRVNDEQSGHQNFDEQRDCDDDEPVLIHPQPEEDEH